MNNHQNRHIEQISSFRNPKIKNFATLQKSRERKKQNLFIVEGLKEIEKAGLKGYNFKSVFYTKDLISERDLFQMPGMNQPECRFYEVSKDIFASIAYRESSGGVVVCAEPRAHGLDTLDLKADPLVLVLESVEKPGNLGAVLRTADAAGLDAVIVCDTQTDVYNPNVVRSSLGCSFTVPLIVAESEEVIDYLNQKQVGIYCTALTASKPYHTIDYSKGAAIVMGTEATGLTNKWLDNSSQNIIIPMKGVVDSMNVSTSAAIVIFEALRQRGF